MEDKYNVGTDSKSLSTSLADTIGYKGEVKIIYKDNNKQKIIKTHNEGKLALFTFLARCMAGLESNDYRPLFLDAFRNEEDATNHISALVQRLAIATTPVLFNGSDISLGNEAADRVQFIFTIPFGNLNSTLTGDISVIKLYNNKNQECASISLETPIPLTSTSNVLVYWTLIFGNN